MSSCCKGSIVVNEGLVLCLIAYRVDFGSQAFVALMDARSRALRCYNSEVNCKPKASCSVEGVQMSASL